jgi:hypothetical protein
MWWTSEDERVLTGAEWDLFRLGLSTLWDDVEMSDEDEEPGTTGVAVFDNLRKPERLALLAQVAMGLHDEGEPCPDLTALLEGTVAAVFAQLRYLIAIEIETDADRIGPFFSGCTRLCWRATPNPPSHKLTRRTGWSSSTRTARRGIAGGCGSS